MVEGGGGGKCDDLQHATPMAVLLLCSSKQQPSKAASWVADCHGHHTHQHQPCACAAPPCTTQQQELLQQEPNVTHVKAPVVVVGDTHGQFHDLLEIFKIAGARSGRQTG